MKIALLLSLAAGIGGAAAADPFERYVCISFLHPKVAEKYSGQVRFDREVYARLIEGRKTRDPVSTGFRVGDAEYAGIAKLGESSNDVYLVAGAGGAPAILKRLKREDLLPIYEYEIAATAFYRAHGVDVPDILARDDARRILVKAYREGITHSEMYAHRHSLFADPEAAMPILTMSLLAEIKRLRGIFEGFPAWSRFGEGKDFGWLDFLKTRGDFKYENFIYDLAERKWIPIDP